MLKILNCFTGKSFILVDEKFDTDTGGEMLNKPARLN